MSEALFPFRKHVKKQRYYRAVSHKVTWWLGTRFPTAVPLLFVVGYPKSGTTWVCQLAADYFQVPFPRASLLPIACPAVVHGHETVLPAYRRSIYVLRDGRDVMASLYFHLARRIADGDNPQLSKREKRMFPGLVNKDDVATNFPRFLEAQMKEPFASRFHWGEHVARSMDALKPGHTRVQYERLLSDGPAELARVVAELADAPADEERVGWTIEKFSFARQSGRKSGKESRTAFLRKGAAGDWRNHFSRESAEIFDRYCGEALVRAGYEPDRSWVQSVGEEAVAT